MITYVAHICTSHCVLLTVSIKKKYFQSIPVGGSNISVKCGLCSKPRQKQDHEVEAVNYSTINKL